MDKKILKLAESLPFCYVDIKQAVDMYGLQDAELMLNLCREFGLGVDLFITRFHPRYYFQQLSLLSAGLPLPYVDPSGKLPDNEIIYYDETDIRALQMKYYWIVPSLSKVLLDDYFENNPDKIYSHHILKHNIGFIGDKNVELTIWTYEKSDDEKYVECLKYLFEKLN